MNLRPIKTRKIYEEIVEQIRHLVTEGQLQPGDRLPSERELAEHLQVSRASVREALSALEMMGLLEVRSGEGTYIRQVNIESVVAPLAWVLSMEKDTVLQLLEVRKILEVQAVSLAAQRADEEDLTEMAEALEAMKADLQINALGDSTDHRFHYAIARATHNQILIHIIDTISDTMKHSLQTIRATLFQGDIPERLYREHYSIYEAVKQHDVVSASERMLMHLSRAEQDMVKNF